MSACPPLLGIERRNHTECGAFNDWVLDFIRHHEEIRTVILAGRWALSAEGDYYGREAKLRADGGVRLVDRYAGGKAGRAHELFDVGITRTVKTLQELNRVVVLVSSVPEVAYDVPSAVVVARRTGRDANVLIGPTPGEYARRNAHVARTFASLGKTSAVRIVSPSARMCGSTRCLVALDAVPLYRDGHHLSRKGAEYVAPVFDPLFSEGPRTWPRNSEATKLPVTQTPDR
jgi:hypothetical protein